MPTACSRVTAEGEPVDGDQIVAILARDLHARRALPGSLVVVTSMSNLGFHRAMHGLGIETASTEVGDRYVLEEMRERGAELGGEQSGHVIALGPPDHGRWPRHCSVAAGGARPRGADARARRPASSRASPSGS